MERTVCASYNGQGSTSSPIHDKVFYLSSEMGGLFTQKHTHTIKKKKKTHLQCHWELKSQPAVIYGSRIYPPIILSKALVLLHSEEAHFSTVWKYSWLNLVELRCRAVPTFPCLKFPSNGVIPSLSFPFHSWVGELYFTGEGGGGVDMQRPGQSSQVSSCAIIMRALSLVRMFMVNPEWMND